MRDYGLFLMGFGLPGPPRVTFPRRNDRFAIRGACEFRKGTARKGPTRQARGGLRALPPQGLGTPHRFGFRADFPNTRCRGTKASRPAARTPTPDQCGCWRIRTPPPVRKLLRPGTVALPRRIRGYVKEQPVRDPVRYARPKAGGRRDKPVGRRRSLGLDRLLQRKDCTQMARGQGEIFVCMVVCRLMSRAFSAPD
jgi:hypothetical protein